MFGHRKRKEHEEPPQELSEEPPTDPGIGGPTTEAAPPKPIGEATMIVRLALDTIDKSSKSRQGAKASASRVVNLLHPLTAPKKA